MNQVVSQIKKREGLFALSILAAIFLAMGKVGDNVVQNAAFKVEDQDLVSAITFVIVGSWIGTILGFICASLFGKKIDPNFKGLSLKTKEFHKWAIISGLFGVGSTLFYLLGSLKNDPSVVNALVSIAFIYVVIYEIVMKRIKKPKSFLVPAMLVFLGSILTSLIAVKDSLEVTFTGLIFVGLLAASLGAVSEVTGKTASDAGGKDPINLQAWRFLWFAVFGTPILVTFTYLTGNFPLLLNTMQEGLVKSGFGLGIALLMLVVFFGEAIKQYLKIAHNSVSKALLATLCATIFVYPIAIVGEIARPGMYGSPLPTDIKVWIGRLAGASILVLGLVWLNIKHGSEGDLKPKRVK